MTIEHYIALGASFIDMDDTLEHYGVKGMKWGTRKGAQAPVTSSGGAGGGAVDPNKLAMDNFYRTFGKSFSQIHALSEGAFKRRTARGDEFCKNIISKQGNKSTKSFGEKLKGVYKAASDFIGGLFSKKSTRLKPKISEKAKSSLERINRSVGINLIKAKTSRTGRGAGISDNIRRNK